MILLGSCPGSVAHFSHYLVRVLIQQLVHHTIEKQFEC